MSSLASILLREMFMLNLKIAEALLDAAWVLLGFDATKKVWSNHPIKNSCESDKYKGRNVR
jgi:hypothetical protein